MVVMIRHFFLLLALAGVATPGLALAGEFTVTDDRAPSEISEVSRLYIDGNLAAIFKLDENVATLTKRIQTPMGRLNHDYALCGEITIVNAEGKRETHQVSSEGTLHHPDGHALEALGAEDFTDFFLRDPEDPSIAQHRVGRAGICAAPIT